MAMTEQSMTDHARDAALLLFSALHVGTVAPAKDACIEASEEIVRQLSALCAERGYEAFPPWHQSRIARLARHEFNALQSMPREFVQGNVERGQARARQLGLLWLVPAAL